MNNYKTIILMAALSAGATGCDFFDGTNRDSRATQPVTDTYTVTVTSVEMVNKDSGEILVIEGFPIEGGVLTAE